MAGDKDGSVIFRDQTMYFVDHQKKTCHTIDKQWRRRAEQATRRHDDAGAHVTVVTSQDPAVVEKIHEYVKWVEAETAKMQQHQG